MSSRALTLQLDPTNIRKRNVLVRMVNLLPQEATSSQITCVGGKAEALSHSAADSFDIVHSNSVIEHVGDRT